MRDDFVVFIITHKRPDNQITYVRIALIDGGNWKQEHTRCGMKNLWSMQKDCLSSA